MNIYKQKLKTILNTWNFWTVATRFMIWFAFFIAGLYFLHEILFPSRTFEYFFDNPDALKNTVADPRINEQGVIKGALSSDHPFIFNTNLIGSYSHALVNLELSKKSAVPQNISVRMQKSYRAFFFPEEGVESFPDGALLTDGEKFFMVSQGQLRQFASTEQLTARKLDSQSFQSTDKNVFSLLAIGAIISNDEFPEGSFVKIDESYYQLKNGILFPFLSNAAFETNADKAWAQSVNKDLLEKYPASGTPIGFRDGTLVSSNESVFILSDGKRYPIDNVDTFTAMGYSWDDLIAITPEELGAYEKQKLFTQDSPHPDGTVFVDRASGEYYLIEKNKKHRFISPLAAQLYLRGSSAIMADTDSIETFADCKMEKTFSLFYSNFACQIPLAQLANLPGNDFAFSLQSNIDIKAKYLNVIFKKVIDSGNMLSSMAQIKLNIKKNYYGNQSQ